MELKPGYKRTEVGVIPEDWELCALRSCCSKITDGTHDTPNTVRFGVPFLTAIHIKDNFIDHSSCLYITDADHRIIWSRCNPELNDVLMVNIGAGVATTALVDVHYEFSLKNVALIKPDNARLIGPYLNYALRQRKNLIIRALSSGGAQPFLSLTQINDINIPVPIAKIEQEAIAEALSDADTLIDSLEQLITKKRHLKQGAMQELLTGKRRLPGFTEAWQTKQLGEICDIRSGGTPSTSESRFWDGGIPWCTPTDITSLQGYKYLYRTNRTISEAGLASSSAEIVQKQSLIMTSRATIGECAINLVPVSTNQGFKNFIPSGEVDIEFIYYLMLTQRANLIALCGGSTFLEIGKKQLILFPVMLPSKRDEQTAIATVLSDMDAEIAILETKLAKARQIKQGMMQELLTGRIRLVNGSTGQNANGGCHAG